MSEEERSADGSVLPLNRGWRAVLGIVFVALAGVHALVPTILIDAVSVGSLVTGIVVLFFDIESFEWQGIKVRRLRKTVQEAATDVAALPAPAPQAQLPLPPPQPAMPRLTLGYQGMVHFPPIDLNPPTGALERFLWAVEQIRIELILLAANAGALLERVTWDQYRAGPLTDVLIQQKRLSDEYRGVVQTIARLRNEAVHGTTTFTADLSESAADLATDLLTKFRAIPRGYARVREANILLYRDQSLSVLHETAGVMIAQIDATGSVASIGVFPRVQDYVRGRFVSWEWTFDRVFDDEAWYRDPRDQVVRAAFASSASFIGREYPTQWGLEYRLFRPDAGMEE